MTRLLRLLTLTLALAPVVAHAAVDVETARLGHGLRAWYASNPTVPVVHVSLSFDGAGSVSDPAGKAGRAALAAAMLNEGAGTMDALAFQQALEEKAIEISFSSDDDRLSVEVHALREHAAAAGQLLALALTQPRFADGDLQRTKSQMLSALKRLEESPAFQANRAFESSAFEGHPYAAPHYGTPQSIAELSADDLRAYMQTYVARSNMLVTAAGDVDGSLLREMLTPLVDQLGRSDAGSVPVAPVTLRGQGARLQVPMQVPQSYVMFVAPGLKRSDERYYAYYLLNEVVGGNSLISRLGDGVRQEKGLVYSIATNAEQRDGIALWRGNLATRNEEVDTAISAVQAILADVRARGITASECEDARSNAIGAFTLQLDGSRPIANTLMMMRIFGLGEDYLDERADKFRAVQCADVNTLAKELLDPARMVTVTVGPQ
jgi:zinc protease